MNLNPNLLGTERAITHPCAIVQSLYKESRKEDAIHIP